MNLFFIDLDGTIEDSRQDMSDCVNLTREYLGLNYLKQDEIIPNVNQGMIELYKSCFSDFIKNNPEKLIEVQKEYENCYFKNVCKKTFLYNGIEDFIKEISTVGKLILVTNKPEHISRELLKKLNLYQFFTDIIGGDTYSECKPSPIPLQLSSQKYFFHKNKDKAFMIGDSLGDILCAKAFGAKSIWCAWGYNSEKPKTEPDFVANNPLDALHFIIQEIKN